MAGPRGGGTWVRTAVGTFSTLLVALACVDYMPIGVPGEESFPVVLALVQAGEDSVFVALGRSGPGTTGGPEPGADLELVTAAGTVPLRQVDPAALACHAPDGFSCYVAALPAPVAPGDSARLTGRLAGGAAVVAATRVPDVPPLRLDGHAPGDTVRWVDRLGQPPVLEIPPGSGRIAQRDSVLQTTWWDGAREEVCTQAPPLNPLIDLRGGIYFGPLVLLLSDPVCDGVRRTSWDSLATSITFLGFDANATRWHRREPEFWRSEGGRWGVDGAVGFFGSMTPAVFTLRVLARSTQP